MKRWMTPMPMPMPITMTMAMCACLSAAVCLAAFKQHHAVNFGGQFDYYMLSLSWAPNYCAGHPGDHSIECRTGQHANFVLHGLWPQASAGQPPTSCAPASPVAAATVRHMLDYYASRGLIQHEWATHGTCSGLSAADYFGKVEQAFNAVKVPDQYRSLDRTRNLSVKEIEQNFASANNADAGAFRVSCHGGELVNLEICMNKDLQYQACTSSVRECPSPQVLLRPVK
ncbi:MAG TPA: ribonuclease T2 [Candidatus Angelobacter sp.]